MMIYIMMMKINDYSHDDDHDSRAWHHYQHITTTTILLYYINMIYVYCKRQRKHKCMIMYRLLFVMSVYCISMST